MISGDLTPRNDESEDSFIWRIGNDRENGLIDATWADIADAINSNFREPGEYIVGKTCANTYATIKRVYDEVFSKLISSEMQAKIREERQGLEKEKIKIADERRELKAILRKKAREESFIEQISRIFRDFPYQEIDVSPYNHKLVTVSDNDMLIPLTDLHYGILINNSFNKYDEEVFKNRIVKYVADIETIRNRHNSQNGYIVLSELISGVIHNELRIESNENVIQQFVGVMNHIIWFLLRISDIFSDIYVYVAPGNHSRIFPNKEDNRKGENIDHLALYYLRGYLQNIENIHFCFNEIDESIAVFDIRGNTVMAVHGDKDTPDNVCRHMTELIGKIPKIVLLGHRHTNALHSANGGCKIIQSGSCSGVDNYCIDNRLYGRPEQVISIIDNNGLVCLYDIGLE